MSAGTSRELDLDECAREPISIPGSIQPRGILLSLDAHSLQVTYASANSSHLLQRDISEVLGAGLGDLLGAHISNGLTQLLTTTGSLDNSAQYLGTWKPDTAGDSVFYCIVAHKFKGNLILELEAARQSPNLWFENLYALVIRLIGRFQQSATVQELTEMAACQIRLLTGFDRVLVYQFSADWSGHVIAESRSDQTVSYLGLWFPASDIPAQARELYRLNRLRLISDVGSEAIPIVPARDWSSKPLDLTFSTLRSVSPIHIEYLKNMGITASMSISIMRDRELWGLLALHNRNPCNVPFEIRVACDLLGQMLSAQLTVLETRSEYEHKLELKSIAAKLLASMSMEEKFADGLSKHPAELMSLGQAGGAAIVFDEHCTLIGRTPSKEDVGQLTKWLSERGEEGVFETDRLPSLMPLNTGLRESASGVLAISISKLYHSYIFWFRPEVERTRNWAGNPGKAADAGDGRLHPRRSFEAWRETVKGRSLPWRSSEIDTAAEFRNTLVGIVLRKAEELAALSAELRRSNKELEAFSYSVSHDLRAPFRHIVGYADLLADHLAPVLDKTAERYITTISAAALSAGILVDDLLNYSRVGRHSLHLLQIDMELLVSEVRRDFDTDLRGRVVVWIIKELPNVEADPVLLRTVWENLLSNAIKFTRKRAEARIEVGSEERPQEVIFYVRDNGAGFDRRYRDKLFGVFQRLHRSEDFEGTGMGLANVRRAIALHGGRTWAEGELNKGATFFFSLPYQSGRRIVNA
jgi:light-regulated signal transduction histidine kinase (bacteriophytochrome)